MESNENPLPGTTETQQKYRLLRNHFMWQSEMTNIRKQVCPDLELQIGGMMVMEAIVNYFMKKLITEATKHVDSNGLDVREIMAAVNQVFPEQLAKNAHQRGLEAVNQLLPKRSRREVKLVTEATKHVDSNGLDVREITTAVNQVFHEQLGKNAHERGLEAVNQLLPKRLRRER